MKESRLSKKEEIRLKHQYERQEQEKNKVMKKTKNWIIGLLVIGLLGLGGWWVIKESSKPLPGLAVEDQGRQHIPRTEWEKFKYNSNPPTSGPHDADWIKAGVYDTPQGDGYLVHSLEHGYIIVSYNCMKLNSKLKSQSAKQQRKAQNLRLEQLSVFRPEADQSLVDNFQFSIPEAYAHEGEDEVATESAASSGSAQLSGDAWQSQACKDLKHELSDIAKENRLWKLIVVPRPNIDVPIVLTAWTRIDKMEKVDKDRIVRFINAYRDQGPEKTME